MRVFRSLALRLSQILASTAAICFLLMAATTAWQQTFELSIVYGILLLLSMIWVVFTFFIIRHFAEELLSEVARILYPAGAVLSLFLSVLLALVLQGQLIETRGQQFVLILAGFMIFIFLCIRCFDIKFLRSFEEIEHIEDKERSESE